MSEQKKKKLEKEFRLTSLSVGNRTTVYVLTFIIVILGIFSYINLPKENFPEITQPTIYVGTMHPGNSPADMEKLITRPLEKEINTISSVDNIQSTSVQDFSTIIVEFTTDTDVQKALQEVKDAVDKARSELPSDLDEEPNVFELNVSEFPILNINLSGNYSVETLNDYAEYLEEEIEKFPEMSKAEIRGVDEKEVRIMVDPLKMEARKVSFSDIENAVQAENMTMSGGNIKMGDIRRTVAISGEYTDPKQLENLIIKNENARIVYLKDIAEIAFDYKEKQSYARLNNKAVVMVDAVKRSGENLLILTDKIYEVVDKAKKEVFPDGLEVVITNDQSQQTRDQVSSLENNIISGVILVVLVLLFFLGSRNALFVGVAIPMSMFMAFMILGALGITINMIVLFSLIMALGMLVDNGIVVVENVYRLMEEGYSPIQATKIGVGEVALPIISSTATTLAAFLPLAFWPGLIGEFMKYLPITLIITLGSSLFVALVINPVFIASFMKLDGDEELNTRRIWRVAGIAIVLGIVFILLKVFVIGNLLVLFGLLGLLNSFILMPASRKFQRSFLPSLERLYSRTLAFAVRGYNPYFFLGGTVVALIGSLMLLGVFTPNVLFFPENEPKYVNVFIEFPVGTDVEHTNEFSLKIEDQVKDVITPYSDIVESVVTSVGKGASDPGDPTAVGQSETPNKGRITVNFVEFKYRDGISTTKVMNEIREAVSDYPGVSITVDKDAAGPPTGKPINIEVTGEDFDELIKLTERLTVFINQLNISGIERLQNDLETGKPELKINIDREKARRFGLSSFTIANEIRTGLFGKEISKYKEGEDDYEIQLRYSDEYRYDVDALINKKITYRDQASGKINQVPISAVADVSYTSTYGSINRKDLNRVVTVYSNVLDGYNATNINEQIEVALRDFQIPTGYTVKFTGEQEEQEKEMAFLSQALLFAVFLIFLIIVAQFNKMTAPFIIMSSVIFSTIGVFLGLVIFQMDFIVVMTMIGIISLAGIVVNNAIVLIDFIEISKINTKMNLEEGESLTYQMVKDAVMEAGKTRLRPVLLTAITTVLGLIPLAIGFNFDFIGLFTSYDPDFYIGGDSVMFWEPICWTIIFGLTFATFLTLIIVPVMYLIANQLNAKFGIGR
ncbi:efflux RND transporter permease subunit [Marivirga sp. S37H4]|uniref:Efflux RND transporter permease subunit n=1 Tax=Marivirga aurantiaca TaxID=2802615 RepID=A0A934WWD1_9BACT|nr:efflux RND transporter permease subunit [Marivirga aurantiaca]MBK6264293.1 efflux RND transporter permease subunit [Marivirga aurantiaca]